MREGTNILEGMLNLVPWVGPKFYESILVYMSTKIPLGGGYSFIRQKYFSINFSISGTKIHENTVILQFTAVF